MTRLTPSERKELTELVLNDVDDLLKSSLRAEFRQPNPTRLGIKLARVCPECGRGNLFATPSQFKCDTCGETWTDIPYVPPSIKGPA